MNLFKRGVFGIREVGSVGVFSLILSAGADEGTPQTPAPPEVVFPVIPELFHSNEVVGPKVGHVQGRGALKGSPSVLVENGENGAGSIEDHTDASYDLLQDEVAGQGDFSFHLATRLNHWFKPTSSVTVTSGCKLFFQSRLGWSTSDQTATVQISTNGGSSWGSTVWTQAGTGDSGETGFSLKEIDLAAFVGKSIQVRFLYSFGGGSFFNQTTSGVGWYVDNIQIGSAFSKELYTGFGDPSDDEQFYLEYINRARASASDEAVRLRDEKDLLITNAYSGFNIEGDDIVAQFAWHVSNGCLDEFAQPLSFNADLLQMARLHTQDMFDQAFQGHVSSDSPPAPYQPGDTLGDRRVRIGYSGGLGENVFSYSRSVAHGHAGFNVDWGNLDSSDSSCYNAAFVGQGMQNPPGHRLTIHNADFREIGIGVINGSNGGVGPQLVTQNFGAGGGVTITGVVYQDDNGNGFYDPGEGISGVRVETPESAFFSVTSSSGGYAIPVDSNGTHAVTFSEGGVATSIVNAVVSDGNNTKLDLVPSSMAESYASWASALGVTGGESGDHDGDGVLNLVEYGLDGFDPLVPDSHLLPKLVRSGGEVTYEIAKDPSAMGVTYAIESSANLDDWSTSGLTILSDTANNLSVSVSPSETAGMFLRIAVVLEP